MAASSHPAPTLNDDILTMIFMGIVVKAAQKYWYRTSARELTALDTVRIASQVCLSWRECLLGSPGIWAKLIHLGGKVIYRSKRLQWMNCVMERAKSAPLWIYGYIRKPTKLHRFDAFSYLTTLFDSDWGRIEHLSVQIDHQDFDSDAAARDLIKLPLLSSAPTLKLFRLQFSNGIGGHTDSSIFQLSSENKIFAGSSPMLQEVYIDSFFELAPSSVSQIRKLVYNNIETIDNVERALNLLQYTPLIECFELKMRSVTWDPNPPDLLLDQKSLSLTHLSSIKLQYGTLSVLSSILGYIHPNALSKLAIKTRKASMTDIAYMSSLRTNLATHISRYLISAPLTTVYVPIEHHHFRISRDQDPENSEDFDIDIGLPYGILSDLSDSFLRSLIDAISLSPTPGMSSSTRCKSVTHFTLQYLDIDVGSDMVGSSHSMLAVFTHVKHLETSEDYSPILLALCDGPQGVIFPQLHTLHLTSCQCDDDNKTFTEFNEFFLKRKNMGHPVAKFDLTGCWVSNYAQDLRKLEDVAGFEIVWRKIGSKSPEGEYQTSSYICGTGHVPALLENVIDNNFSDSD